MQSTPSRYDKIEVRRDGPIVQRIGHTPSKGTMLVRFQLGLPGKRVLFFQKRAPMLKQLITKRSHAHVVTSFFGQAILKVGGAVVEHFAVYAGIILCFVALSSSEEEIAEVWFGIDSGQLGVSVEIIDGVAIVFLGGKTDIWA